MHNGPFWTLAANSVVLARDRSETQSTTLRKAEYLPPAEVVISATEAVKDNVRLGIDQLVVEVARRLGFQRTGPDLQHVIANAVEAQLGIQFQRLEDGSVMLSTPH
jgi:hypothetical protein